MIEQQEMVGTESEFLLEHLYIHGGACHGAQLQSRTCQIDVLRHISCIQCAQTLGCLSVAQGAELALVAGEHKHDGSRSHRLLAGSHLAAQVLARELYQSITFDIVAVSASSLNHVYFNVLTVERRSGSYLLLRLAAVATRRP